MIMIMIMIIVMKRDLQSQPHVFPILLKRKQPPPAFMIGMIDHNCHDHSGDSDRDYLDYLD